MDYFQLRKKKFINKYHDSDIFNTRAESNLNKSYHPPRYKTAQPSLEKTKSDVFNTKEKSVNPAKTKPLKRKIYINNYKSDIFNIKKSPKHKKSCQRINVNHSTCFDGIKNDEEYNKDLNKYTLTHRPNLKKYEVEQFFTKESALNRYYKELYGDEKSGVFPEKLNKTVKNSPSKNIMNTFKNNMKNFEARKKRLKREITEINDVGVDGKRKPGEHLGQEIDDKGKKIIYNKRKIDIYGESKDKNNNRKDIKEKSGLLYNSKYNQRLEFNSNIFNEENKDINKKMDDFIVDKIKESENKKILKDKIKKEKEEMAKKIKELKKQNMMKKENIKLAPATMKWHDPESEILFKKTFTVGDLNNNNEEITAFERKIKDISDSNNIDTLSKIKKPSYFKKLKKLNLNIDDNNKTKIKTILNTLPGADSLREDQIIGMINKSTTSNFLNDSKNDEKMTKYYNTITTNIKSARLSKSRKKKDNIIKIMGKNGKILNKSLNNSKNKTEYKVHDYTLVYSIKHNKFDKFENDDIKKILGARGVHAFDIRKNELLIGDLNNVKFKVRETDENNEKNIDEKMKLIEDDLNMNKYRVKINKDKIKKITKDNRNMKEKEIKEKGKFNKTPYKSKGKKNFTSQFPKVNVKYKQFHKE